MQACLVGGHGQAVARAAPSRKLHLRGNVLGGLDNASGRRDVFTKGHWSAPLEVGRS